MLEQEVKKQDSLWKKYIPSKQAAVDTFANITYSLVVGGGLDCNAGLDCAGIATSRATGTLINIPTSAPYGHWRNNLYKITHTNEESTSLRKTITDLVAFNTFQTPLYFGVIAFSTWMTEGKPNWEKATNGATYLTMISPFLGPTMGWYMDKVRGFFGVKKATEINRTPKK